MMKVRPWMLAAILGTFAAGHAGAQVFYYDPVTGEAVSSGEVPAQPAAGYDAGSLLPAYSQPGHQQGAVPAQGLPAQQGQPAMSGAPCLPGAVAPAPGAVAVQQGAACAQPLYQPGVPPPVISGATLPTYGGGWAPGVPPVPGAPQVNYTAVPVTGSVVRPVPSRPTATPSYPYGLGERAVRDPYGGAYVSPQYGVVYPPGGVVYYPVPVPVYGGPGSPGDGSYRPPRRRGRRY